VHVALTHPYSWPEVRRGAERIIVETARALAGRGHEVTILTSGSRPGRARRDGVTTVTFRRRLADAHRHERWFGLRLLPNLAVGRFDVVHSFMPYDTVAAIRTRRVGGHRTVYDEMGIPIDAWWTGRPEAGARRRIVRDVDVYGCMSRFALDALERECGRRGVLIPGGVRLSEFAPAPAREPVPTFLFSGALDEPRKGVADLLAALALVSEVEPAARVWLSGPGDPGPMLAAAPESARQRVDVLPLGEPGEQAARYGRAWATVLPSVNESFGMVLLESLACGTPIVVTNDAAPQELVRPGTGVVCEPADPSSLAKALLEATELATRDETVERCRRSAADYDWDEGLAPRLEAIYTAPLDR
jgi:phosphatidylinositol alpha-mannosyltransferase